MNKEVKYNGYSAQPSDYECQDGELAAAINLVPEDGALKPIGQPTLIMQLSAENKVIYIHKTSSYEHYIVRNTSTDDLYWVDSTDTYFAPSETVKIGNYKDLLHINAIGNTLMVFTSRDINYILWKSNTYNVLGNHIPNLAISFGLKGTPCIYSHNDKDNKFTVVFEESIPAKDIYKQLSDKNQKRITEQIMAKLNPFLAEESVNKGRFALPFLVRYALRLYDGSLACHSAPILMNPATTAAPLVLWDRISGSGGYSEALCDIMLVSAKLDYKAYDNADSQLSKLAGDWEDIVKSVDIFISKPIYAYDQNGTFKSFNDTDGLNAKFIGALDNPAYCVLPTHPASVLTPVIINGVDMPDNIMEGFKPSILSEKYVEWTYGQLYQMFFSKSRDFANTILEMPEYSMAKIQGDIKDTSQFYFLKSIPIKELSITERKDIEVDKDYLKTLVTREVMTDDYLTHDRLIADFSHAYNSRLNLSGVKRELFNGFCAETMFAYTNAECPMVMRIGSEDNVGLNITIQDSVNVLDIDVYIKENGETYKVNANGHNQLGPFFSNFNNIRRSSTCYMFYPNTSAFKMVIKNGSFEKYEVELKPHDFLNGAYCLLEYETVRKINGSYIAVTKDDNIIDMPNKIYTSEINNPFFFPVNGINSVGTGKILGMSSANKALSQGQFGQFPLYAFTDEGVWALEVSTIGTYSAKQPITRDVCINADSITQIDSSVLFPTDRGIMLISGSQTQCITDTIKTEFPFEILSLPHMKELHDKLNHDPATDKCLPIMPFTEFLKLCRMIYDYVHQRIIVYNPAVTYAYVYSLKSNLWGMIYSNIADNVNSYPNALAMDTKGNLVDFSVETTEKKERQLKIVPCMLVTRPLKLDGANIHKTIDNVIQRGYFQKGHVQSVLYGSRDLENWYLVWSSKDHFLRGFRGTSYKYFRIALVCSLSPDERIFGTSIQSTPRLTNQPR